MIILYILLILMIVGAIAVLQLKDLFSSVIALGAVGLVLCLMFLMLNAPEVALTQLLVELLCILILIKTTLKKDLPFSASGRWVFNTVIMIGFICVFLAISSRCFNDLSAVGQRQDLVPQQHTTASLIDFRFFDSLVEAFIIFTAVLAVLAVLRRSTKKPLDENKVKQ